MVHLFGPAVAESIAIAAQPGYALWTDDFAVGEVSRNSVGLSRVWTQAVFDQLLNRNVCSKAAVTRLTLALVEMKYSFTRVSPEVVLDGLKNAQWNHAASLVLGIARWLHLSGVKAEGVVAILANILRPVWQEAPLFTQAEDITRLLASKVRDRPDGQEILDVVQRNLPRIFNTDVVNCDRCANVIERVKHYPARGIILPGNGLFR